MKTTTLFGIAIILALLTVIAVTRDRSTAKQMVQVAELAKASGDQVIEPAKVSSEVQTPEPTKASEAQPTETAKALEPVLLTFGYAGPDSTHVELVKLFRSGYEDTPEMEKEMNNWLIANCNKIRVLRTLQTTAGDSYQITIISIWYDAWIVTTKKDGKDGN